MRNTRCVPVSCLPVSCLRLGQEPTSKDVLERAVQAEREVVGKTTPRMVSEILKRFGITTTRTGQGRRYRGITLERLKEIERNYGLELHTDGDPSLQVQVRGY